MKECCRGQAPLRAIVSTLVLLTLLIESGIQANRRHQEVLDLIRGRSPEEWQHAWHSECFRRCRAELIPHVNLACHHDIYRIGKRSAGHVPNVTKELDDVRSHSNQPQVKLDKNNRPSLKLPFLLQATAAFNFLKRKYTLRKRSTTQDRGIMEECCYMKACTWEEYAETCRFHSRTTSQYGNRCI